jgi:hypothetical protein
VHISTFAAAFMAFLTCGLAGAQTSSTIPASPEEALRLLRHTQAAESDWNPFPDFTSVAMKNRVRLGSGQPVETEVAIFLKRASDGSAQLMLIANGRSVDAPASFDLPELDAAKATFVQDETISAAGKTFRTKLYSFAIEGKTADGVFLTRHRYWLAAGVPGGVVRHESIGASSGERLTPGGGSVTVLSELDVPFTLQGKVLSGYCYATQTDWPDGSKDLSRVCKQASVPGGIIRLEQRERKNGVEVRFETTDLEEVTPPTPPGAASPGGTNAGCEFPASLMGDLAQTQLENGDYTLAAASLDAFIQVSPMCARAYNDRGYAKMKLKDRSAALADFDRAIELAPRLTQAYVNRAVLKRDNNDLKGALAECNAALRIDSKYFSALVNRMVIYLRLFDDDHAISDYKAALEAMPASGDSLDRVVVQERKRRGAR